MAGRASIVGAAATHVGKVRDHNEDAHFVDHDLGVFLVCDGMGGHAAGEVASALAIRAIRSEWGSAVLRDVVEQWLERGTPDARKRLIEVVRKGVLAAHHAILAEADRDDSKSGMGTTLVGAMIVGGELVFAHAGDSRAYLVRDGIAMQLTEDHTLLARLVAAGIDVDVSGEGSRFRSMLTNALGIGEECKVSTFVVPLADGDRFLLCSDGISEYIHEAEVGDVLVKLPSPARAAQRLIDLALERGGGDNATAVVVRVLEAGETPLPAEQRRRDDTAIGACALWGRRVTPQQRLRALRIAIPRDHGSGDRLPPYALGDRIAWIIVEGELVQDGQSLGPGAFIYPESLLVGEPVPLPDRDALASARTDVRALAIRADDFRELCDDDGELGEALLESLAQLIAKRRMRTAPTQPLAPRGQAVDPGATTDPQLQPLGDVPEAQQATDPNLKALADRAQRAQAVTPTDEVIRASRTWPPLESAVIAPAPPRASSPQLAPHAPARPSPPLPAPRGTAATAPGPLLSPAALASALASAVAPTHGAPSPPAASKPASVPQPTPPVPPNRPSPMPGAAPPETTAAAAPAAPLGRSAVAAATVEPARSVVPPAKPPAVASPPARTTSGDTASAARSAGVAAASAASAPAAPAASPPSPASPASSVVVPGPAPMASPRTSAALAASPPAALLTASGPATVDRPAKPGPRVFSPPMTPPMKSEVAASRATHATTKPASHATANAAPIAAPIAPSITRATTPMGAAQHRRALPLPAPDSAPPPIASSAADRSPRRPPSDPEIEAFFEIEAELPPDPRAAASATSQAALAIGLGHEDEHESVSITFDDEAPEIERVARVRTRAITAQDASAVSGTISIPEELPPPSRRAKRQGDGWDE